MKHAGRYNELLFMVDTCQANTMYSKLYSPNILATGSSKKGENSYSVRATFSHCVLLTHAKHGAQYQNDMDIGVAVIDSFTHHALEFMEGMNKTSHVSMKELVRYLLSPICFIPYLLQSHSLIRTHSRKSVQPRACVRISSADL